MKRGLLLLLLLLTACAAPRPAPPGTAAELAAVAWPAGRQLWVLRHSALFELRGAKMPVSGLLRLDAAGRQARLVGLNDLGVKLFDIAVTAEGETVHFLLPELARFPGAGEAVAASVRRIFLAPRPAPGDRARAAGDGWLLQRTEGGTDLRFRFAGAEPQLVEKRGAGAGEDWRVSYHEYRPEAGEMLPGRILFDDFLSGYRLTLWLEEVKKDNEPADARH